MQIPLKSNLDGSESSVQLLRFSKLHLTKFYTICPKSHSVILHINSVTSINTINLEGTAFGI